MYKKIFRRLMLLFYCIPFAFLAMYGDAMSGSMMFLGVMLAGFGLLCSVAVITNNANVLIIGNLLSFLSSTFFTLIYLPVEWSWYFKPLTPMLLLILITTILFSIQYFIIRLFSKHKKRKQYI